MNTNKKIPSFENRNFLKYGYKEQDFQSKLKKLAHKEGGKFLKINAKGQLSQTSLIGYLLEKVKSLFGQPDMTNSSLLTWRWMQFLESAAAEGGVQKNLNLIHLISERVGIKRNLEDVELLVKELNKESKDQSKISAIFKSFYQKENLRAYSPQILQIITPEIAATHLQRVFRGQKIRQLVVLPRQIRPFINEYLPNLEESKRENLIKIICREMHVMTLNSSAYKGKSIRIDPSNPYWYPFFQPNQLTKKEEVHSEHICWLEMSNDGKSIDLLVATDELGTGSFKTVYRAHTVDVSMKLKSCHRVLSYNPQVFIQIMDPIDFGTVQKGLEIQGRVIEAISEGAKIVSSPVERKGGIASLSTMELKQDWYHGDLLHASNEKSIPLDLNGSQQRKITFLDQLEALIDVHHSLSLIHAKNIIHRDIKPENILLKVNAEGKIEGYISDWDLSSSPMKSSLYSNYSYWDESSKEGWVTPLSDWYGLVISLGTTLIPHFEKIRREPNLLNQNTLEGLIGNAIKTHLKDKFKSLKLAFDSEEDLNNREKVQNYLKLLHEQKQIEERELIILQAEFRAMTQIFTLVIEAIKISKAAYQYLLKDTHLQNVLILGDKEETARAMKKLEAKFPLEKKIKETLEPLKITLEAAYLKSNLY